MNDPVLGFFHRWVEKFSGHYEKITVIALGVGAYHLPANIKVLSLGKEAGRSRLKYILNFYRYIWEERKNYDVVFVHMNQEYVLLGWKLWRVLGKKIWFWRNHPRGSMLTDLAVWMSDRVFCTSKYSYTARFKKTEIMPVGIDTELFVRKPEIKRVKNSILSLGRIAPIKNIDLLIEALNILNKEKFNFNAAIIGDAKKEDARYLDLIKSKVSEYGLEQRVHFKGAVPPREITDIYNSYELFVNLTPTGSMDKTIFEAMACESMVLTSNQSLRGLIDNTFVVNENNAISLASNIEYILSLTESEKDKFGKDMRIFAVKDHGLDKLIDKLSK